MDYHVGCAIAVDVQVNVCGSGVTVIAVVGFAGMPGELVDQCEGVVQRGARVGVDGREIDLVALRVGATLLAAEIKDEVRGGGSGARQGNEFEPVGPGTAGEVIRAATAGEGIRAATPDDRVRSGISGDRV